MAKMNNKKIGAEGQASGNKSLPLLSQFVIGKTEKEQQTHAFVKVNREHL